MKIIELSNVLKSFYGHLLYSDVSFKLYHDEKILICGSNGSGKTTLANIIFGKIAIDDGEVHIEKNVIISSMPQLQLFNASDTVFDYLQELCKELC